MTEPENTNIITPPGQLLAHSKTTTRIALVNLDEPSSALLTDCFKQFKIQAVIINENPIQRLLKEKFEGCAVVLEDDDAEEVLKAARNAPSNRLMVLYGIQKNPQTARRFSPYGINAVLNYPLERNAALKMVRGTYLLAIHEFRRYVRVPVVVDVSIETEGRSISTLSQEVSSGGMSLEVPEMLPRAKNVVANFTLPGAKWIAVRATVCWRRESSNMFGIRFDQSDSNRQLVRAWIEKFLESQD